MRIRWASKALGGDAGRSDDGFGDHRGKPPTNPRACQKHHHRCHFFNDDGQATEEVDLEEGQVGDDGNREKQRQREGDFRQRAQKRVSVAAPPRQAVGEAQHQRE